MDNIFVGEPGLKEFRVILRNERTSKRSLRHNIRNYDQIKNLKGVISNSRLSSITRFYKTRSEYQTFKIVYFLERRLELNNLRDFRKKSDAFVRSYLEHLKIFYSNLRRRISTHSILHSAFFTSSLSMSDQMMENEVLKNTQKVDDSNDDLLTSDSSTTNKNQSIKMGFDDTSRENISSKKMFQNVFFTSDLFFKEIGENSIYSTRLNEDEMKENLEKITINLKFKRSTKEDIPKALIDKTDKEIVFTNDSKDLEIGDGQAYDLDTIMNQTPNKENQNTPKPVDFDSFIVKENDQVNFNFKKIVVSEQTVSKPLSRHVLGPKDVNRQSARDDEKAYDKLLKRNTHANSNYKFIKVYHTNAMPKRASIGYQNRERVVSFVENYNTEPHNTDTVKPILHKSKGVQKMKPCKTKQTVFIKRLV